MGTLRLFAFGLFFLAATGVSEAAPRAIQDCEKIEAADAYNRCLAQFGPAAREHELSHTVPRNETSFRARRRGHWREHGVKHAQKGERVRMEFTISPRRPRH